MSDKGGINSGSDSCCLYVGIQYDCLYQNGKERNNSLCLFVPGATAVP